MKTAVSCVNVNQGIFDPKSDHINEYTDSVDLVMSPRPGVNSVFVVGLVRESLGNDMEQQRTDSTHG